MARIRTVKPGYHKHKKVRQVGRDARLLNIGLWNLADDEGRLQDLPNSIIGDVFPTDDDVTPVVLREWCRELEEAGLIVRYQVDGEDYIQCHDFNDHQVINKPRPSEIPPPPEPSRDDSGPPPVAIPEASRPEKEREGEKEEEPEGETDVARVQVREVDGIKVSDEEHRLTFILIQAIAVEAQQKFTPESWIQSVVPCLRVHPELSESDHLAIIRANCREPWWDHSLTPSMFYSKVSTFENALARWRGGGPVKRTGTGRDRAEEIAEMARQAEQVEKATV